MYIAEVIYRLHILGVRLILLHNRSSSCNISGVPTVNMIKVVVSQLAPA